MKNKFTTIKLKFDVSISGFENFVQITGIIVKFTKTYSIAQLNNYQFFTIKKIPDERELEFLKKNPNRKRQFEKKL